VQPLLASSLSNASELQPNQRTGTRAYPGVQHTHARSGQQANAEVRSIRARGRRRPWRPRSDNDIVIYVSCSTEPVTHCLLTVAADVIALIDFYAPRPDREQEVLERSFARLAAFGLEPEQPADKDVIRRPVYRFPNR